MMQLELTDVSDWPIKGPNDNSYHGQFPKRMKFLHPNVVSNFRSLFETTNWNVVLTDMYRDPIASLQARKSKIGVQRPGCSAHNYGIAVDVAMDSTLSNLKVNYSEFLDMMLKFGLTCHRSDRERDSEDWHFNCLGFPDCLNYYASDCNYHGSTGPQLWIKNNYGSQMSGDLKWTQERLQEIGFYRGEIDGQFGPLSITALNAFQRAYDITSSSQTFGLIFELTQKTLAIVTAKLHMTKLYC